MKRSQEKLTWRTITTDGEERKRAFKLGKYRRIRGRYAWRGRKREEKSSRYISESGVKIYEHRHFQSFKPSGCQRISGRFRFCPQSALKCRARHMEDVLNFFIHSRPHKRAGGAGREGEEEGA